jgi:hypothetical protein
MGAFKNIMNGATYGIQGFLDQAQSEIVGGLFGGVFGFASETFKGIAGFESGIHNKTGLGKITGGLGYGLGSAIGTISRPLAKGVSSLAGTIPHDTKVAQKLTENIFNAITTDKGMDAAKEMGLGLFGRRIKRPVAWAISAGAIGYGLMKGTEEHSYNLGMKTAVNGIMDTQGVLTTPGGVNQTYIPITRGKKINNHGADADLVFAMHNRRNG